MRAALLIPLVLLMVAIPTSVRASAPVCPPPAESAEAPPVVQPGEAVIACVGSQPLSETTFKHWYEVATARIVGGHNHHVLVHAELIQVMGFLLSAAWVQGEAKALHVHVSPAAVHRRFEQIRHQQFRHNDEFLRFLRSSKQTVADLLMRVELDMLSQRIQRRIVSGHRRARARQKALAHFIHHFRTKWTARTYCAPRYAMLDCGHVQSNL